MQPKNEESNKISSSTGVSDLVYWGVSIFNQFLCRQADGDGASGHLVVGSADGATHQMNKFFYQRQADSSAACGAGKRVIHTVKVVEDFF